MEQAESAVAAARIRDKKEQILNAWKERVRESVPSARHTPGSALVDSLPEVVDRLVDALGDPSAVDALEREEERLAAAHGQQRAQLESYSLDQVIAEYQVLRDVVLSSLGEDDCLGNAARDTVCDFVLLSIRHSASEFARLRDEEKERTEAALRDANRDLERRVEERLAELRESETRFRHFVESVEDYAIFTLDPNGFITSWNDGCARVKQYTAEEAIGSHFSMLYPEEGKRRDEPMGHLRSAAIEGRFRGEGVRVRKNGDLFLADVCITPIYDGEVLVGFTKVVQDLTERNILMQERDLSRSDADRLRTDAAYRDTFVATLTHDLRSPLSSAMTRAELIRLHPGSSEEVRGWAEGILDAVRRADRMISDLLDAARVDSREGLSLDMEHCDLKEIAAEACRELSSRHGDRFTIDVDGATTGFWNRDGLRRVLDNLLANALKYGEAERPITIGIRRVDDHVLLTVHNYGSIIPAEEQQKLFRPFHRTRTAYASRARGWGIGLTLVKGVAEAHGGMVKVESYRKEGTTFTVDLPADARGAARAR